VGGHLKEISEELKEVSLIVSATHELAMELRYSAGIEKINGYYKAFIEKVKDLESKLKEFEYAVFECQQHYHTSLNPVHMEAYLEKLVEKDGIPKMMEALDFIIAAEVKYLFMMVTFDSHKEDEVAVKEKFETFNDHINRLNTKAKELAVTRIIGEPYPVSEFKILRYKMKDGTMLHKLVMDGDLSSIKAVERFLSPELLKKKIPGSRLKEYIGITKGVFNTNKIWKEVLPLRLAVLMVNGKDTPDYPKILRLIMLKQEGKVDTEEEAEGEETKNQLRDACIAEMKRVLKEEELAMKHVRLQTKEENRNKMKEEEDRLIQEYEEAMNRITEGKMAMKSSANMKIQEMEDMLRSLEEKIEWLENKIEEESKIEKEIEGKGRRTREEEESKMWEISRMKSELNGTKKEHAKIDDERNQAISMLEKETDFETTKEIEKLEFNLSEALKIKDEKMKEILEEEAEIEEEMMRILKEKETKLGEAERSKAEQMLEEEGEEAPIDAGEQDSDSDSE